MKPTTWLWVGAGASLVGIGLLDYFFPGATPSRWLHLEQHDVEEWLAWIGLAAFVFSLAQLSQSASAAQAARQATLAAVNRIEEFDASKSIDQAILFCESAANAVLRRDFRAARTECDRVLKELAQVEAFQARLDSEDATLLKGVRTLVVSALGGCGRALQGTATADEIRSLEDSLRQQQRDLMRVSNAIRARHNKGIVQ
jgi:hypothetical protein